MRTEQTEQVEQYVMAYGVEQDRLRALLPEGFVSLRPVLRLNAEIRGGSHGYIEFNTAIEKDGNKGWLNIGYWHDVPFERDGKTVTFKTDFLELTFTGAGIEGACPAEKDNDGCYFLEGSEKRIAPEIISVPKEFCDCRFKWKFTDADASSVSTGKTLPAYPAELQKIYPREDFTAKNAAQIPCEQVLGSYVVRFMRQIIT